MSSIETVKYCQACYYLAYWLGISRRFVMNLIWSVAPVNLQLIPRSSLLHASMINTSNSHPSNTLTCVNTIQEQDCWVTFSGRIYASDLASWRKKIIVKVFLNAQHFHMIIAPPLMRKTKIRSHFVLVLESINDILQNIMSENLYVKVSK